MENFNLEKNGYNKFEVEEYIENLKRGYEETLNNQKERINELKTQLEDSNASLNKYVEKNENISDALVVAVETAKQIENSSKNIYDLEIKRIRVLYAKWENFLNEMLIEYPKLKEKFDTKALLKVFSDGINNVIKQNSATVPATPSQAMGLRNLINKMSMFSSKQEVKPQNSYVSNEIFKNNEYEFADNLTSIGTVRKDVTKEPVKQPKNNFYYEEPVRPTQNVVKPAEVKKEVVKPVEFKKEVTKPVEVKQETVKPAEIKKEVVKPTEVEKEESFSFIDMFMNQAKARLEEEKNVIVRKEKPAEPIEQAEKKTKIKSISNIQMDKNDKFENLVDKFLSVEENEENDSVSQYEKALLKKKQKESGFDFGEALNPTDDLTEIMKSFDAFNDTLFDIDFDDDGE